MTTRRYCKPPMTPMEPHPGGPGITLRTSEALRRTKPWVILISVLLWIGVGFMLLLAAFMLFAGIAGSAIGNTAIPQGLLGVGMACLYGLMSLLYIFPAIFLWRYGRSIGRMLDSASVNELEGALEAQKSFWKFTGVAAIVVMAFYILMFVGLLVFGLISALN